MVRKKKQLLQHTRWKATLTMIFFFLIRMFVQMNVQESDLFWVQMSLGYRSSFYPSLGPAGLSTEGVLAEPGEHRLQ